MDVVNRIIDLIEKNRLEQKDLAKYLNTKPQVISDWKSGKTKSYKKYINEIAQFFGVSVDYLLNGSPEPAVVVSDNVLNNINGDNNINVTLSDDEQILNMIKDLDLVQKSKVILAIDEIRKGN